MRFDLILRFINIGKHHSYFTFRKNFITIFIVKSYSNVYSCFLRNYISQNYLSFRYYLPHSLSILSESILAVYFIFIFIFTGTLGISSLHLIRSIFAKIDAIICRLLRYRRVLIVSLI